MRNFSTTLVLTLLILNLFVPASAELKFIVELYRHGARTPLGNWYDATQQAANAGELTSTGMRQHYNLGVKLKEEYAFFLPTHYNHSQIYVRASDVNRTLMSAESQLQGMFPEGTGSILPANLSQQYTLPWFEGAQSFLEGSEALEHKIQVVPIHTQTVNTDLVLQPDANCPNYNSLKNLYYQQKNNTINFINSQFAGTYSIYTNAVNQTVKTFDNMGSLQSTLECDRYNGRYVPSFSQEALNNATFLDSISWNMRYGQPELLRALNTPFIQQLLSYITPVTQPNYTNPLKWVMFSAHDTNVHLVSAALNITSTECLLSERFPEFRSNNTVYYNCEQYPRFTASLIFELHQAEFNFTEEGVSIAKNEFYIKLRRDGKFMKVCDRNSTVCSFSEFSQRLTNFEIDFNSICGYSNTQTIKLFHEREVQRFTVEGSSRIYQDVPQVQSLSQVSIDNATEISYGLITLILLQQAVIIAAGWYFYKSKKSTKVEQQEEPLYQSVLIN